MARRKSRLSVRSFVDMDDHGELQSGKDIMRDCVIFQIGDCLDQFSIRSKATRIPEVMKCIYETQQIYDNQGIGGFDLANFLLSEDVHFLNHFQLRRLSVAVVQIGLYQRYLRQNSYPDFLIGTLSADSPVEVASGEKSFFDMVLQSPGMRTIRPLSIAEDDNDMNLPFQAFQKSDLSYHPLDMPGADLKSAITLLAEKFLVQRFVTIGPKNLDRNQFDFLDIQTIDSVDLDPLLSWFWTATPKETITL